MTGHDQPAAQSRWYVDRAALDSREMHRLLEAGWEPFGVAVEKRLNNPQWSQSVIYLRRRFREAT